MKHWFDTARLISMRAQIFFLIVTVIFVSFIVRFHQLKFSPAEKPEYPRLITQEVIEKWGHAPLKVPAGLVITDFIKFENTKNQFILDAIIWFQFDPKKVPLEKIGLFDFESAQIVKISKPIIEKNDDTIIARYYVRVKFEGYLDHSRFPFDDHYLQLDLYNASFQADEITFIIKQSDFTLSETIKVSGWVFQSHQVKTGYEQVAIINEHPIEHPQAIFYILMNKQNLKQLILILLPLFFIFFFCMLTLSLASSSAIPMVLGGISALLAYMFVINGLSPTVGYLMLSDYFVILLLCEIFFIFLVHMLCVFHAGKMNELIVNRVKGLVVLGLYIILYIVWAYLIIML